MKPVEVGFGIAAGLLLALAIDLFGVPALISVTLLLIVSVAVRARGMVLACAVSCGIVLALWLLATARCDQTLQDCAVNLYEIVLFSWLAAGLVIGLAATWVLARRPQQR